MKRVKVNAYQVALVFKDGVYQQMLKEGNYWLWNKEAYVYDLTKPFVAPIELNILLKDAELAEALQVVEVKDNGKGFNPERLAKDRLGIRTSIQARMQSIGGQANIASELGVGTQVELRWSK